MFIKKTQKNILLMSCSLEHIVMPFHVRLVACIAYCVILIKQVKTKKKEIAC